MPRPATHSCSTCHQKMAAAKLRDGKCKPGHGCAADAPTGDAKPAPAAPEKPRPATNRKGKPASDAPRCQICTCDDTKQCDLGAGRTCVWTTPNPKGASLCSLCAELIDAAEELLERVPEPTPQEVAASLAESCEAPCVAEQAGEKRIAACVTAAIARLKANGEAPTEAETQKLPRKDYESAAKELGPCSGCGIELGQQHLAGCTRSGAPLPAAHAENVLCEPCDPTAGGCDAAIGVPCAFTPQEPASWAHAARFDRFADRETREALRRRGIEDRILGQCDYHARLPGDPPVPAKEGLVRGLTVEHDCSAPELRERIEAMLERGAIREQGGAGGNAYLRRAPGGAPIAMGRVGLMVGKKAEPATTGNAGVDDGADLLAEHLAADCERMNDRRAADIAPLPPGADGGNWGAPHDCGRPDLKVIVTYPEASPPNAPSLAAQVAARMHNPDFADVPPPSPRRFVEPDTAPDTPDAKREAGTENEEAPAPAQEIEAELRAAEEAIETAGDMIDRALRKLRALDDTAVIRLRAELEAEQRAHMATRGREATARAELDEERASAGAKAEKTVADLRGKLDQAYLDQRAAETARDRANERVDGLRLGVSTLCEFLGAEKPADETDTDLLQALRLALGQAVSAALAEHQAKAGEVRPVGALRYGIATLCKEFGIGRPADDTSDPVLVQSLGNALRAAIAHAEREGADRARADLSKRLGARAPADPIEKPAEVAAAFANQAAAAEIGAAVAGAPVPAKTYKDVNDLF